VRLLHKAAEARRGALSSGSRSSRSPKIERVRVPVTPH
jgi:hypothetical protein